MSVDMVGSTFSLSFPQTSAILTTDWYKHQQPIA